MRKYLILIISAILLFTVSCSNINKTISYIFHDTRAGFRIDYPSNWRLTEQIGIEGSAEYEGSPDTGIEFDFSKNENEIEKFTIKAMLSSSLSFDRENYEAEEFITDNNILATIYKQITEDECISVFYVFDETELPCYFASINMSVDTYDKYKEDIQNVMKSFKPVK